MTSVTFLEARKSLSLHDTWRVHQKHILSSESPRHNNSSMFFVIILVTSCRSSLSLSRLDPAPAARVSWYSLAVLDMNVSVCDPVSQFGPRKHATTATNQSQQTHTASVPSQPLHRTTWRIPLRVRPSKKMQVFVDRTCRQWLNIPHYRL